MKAAAKTPALVPLALVLSLGTAQAALAQAQTTTAANRPAALTNTDLAPEVRAQALVDAMTLEEKAAQLGHTAPPIPRLGVPGYNWWNEALHGAARAGEATVFPQAIGMAATWDPALIERMGHVVSAELRAKWRAKMAPDGSVERYRGLTVWSPNINIFRDPRWGRGQETYGEDPYLTSRIAIGYVRGLQGDDPDYLRVSANAKHYAVHSGPESNRHREDVSPTAHDLEDTYLPAFRALVTEGKVDSVMCAYNAVFGVPACASDFLLKERLRRDWGFTGHVVTDCGAAANIYRDDALRYVKTPELGVKEGFEAGMDVICGDYRNNMTTEAGPIVNAVRSGLMPEAVIDVALRRAFTTRVRLGMFNPLGKEPFIDIKANASPNDPALAREVADKSMVLLKNDGLLPLKSAPKRIAVVGPNADNIDSLIGNYNGTPIGPVTVLSGIKARWPKAQVTYAEGTGLVGAPTPQIPAAVLCLDAACRKRGVNEVNHAGTRGEGAVRSRRTVPLAEAVWWENARDGSTVWTGYIKAPETGEFALGFSGVNGYELTVDGKVIQRDWNERDAGSLDTGKIRFEKGKTYPFRLVANQANARGDQRLTWSAPSMDGSDAVAAARDADLVVFVAGLSGKVEGEEMKVNAEGFAGGDRTRIDLPKPQQALLEKVVAAGKPTVLVLMNGSALAVNWADKHVPAIIEAWYPGAKGGAAVAGVIAGDVNPAGRLPVTFYKDVNELPGFSDYSMANRTYRYHKGEVLYPFGHGLSFTSFAYKAVQANESTVMADGTVTIHATVTNTGPRDGDEVVQLYLTHADQPGTPLRALAGFQRVALKAGESKALRFTLSGRQLSTVDAKGERAVRPGTVKVWLGGGQPVAREGLAQAPGAETSFEIKGEMKLPK